MSGAVPRAGGRLWRIWLRQLRAQLQAFSDGFPFFRSNGWTGWGSSLGYSTADTAGCSCEQIIGALGLGQVHTRRGCSIRAMNEWVSGVAPACVVAAHRSASGEGRSCAERYRCEWLADQYLAPPQHSRRSICSGRAMRQGDEDDVGHAQKPRPSSTASFLANRDSPLGSYPRTVSPGCCSS
jgi:hypothetical protein